MAPVEPLPEAPNDGRPIVCPMSDFCPLTIDGVLKELFLETLRKKRRSSGLRAKELGRKAMYLGVPFVCEWVRNKSHSWKSQITTLKAVDAFQDHTKAIKLLHLESCHLFL